MFLRPHRMCMVLALCGGFAAPALAEPPTRPVPHWRDYGPPSYYGYPLDDRNPGYFGGGRYREYYSYGRGPGPAPSNFPGNLPFIPDPRWPRGIPLGPTASPPPLVQMPAPVHVIVWVPPDAQVWFDDVKTSQVGPAREFISPALPTDRLLVYHIRATWMEDGKPVEQSQAVEVRGGQRVAVRFPLGR